MGITPIVAPHETTLLIFFFVCVRLLQRVERGLQRLLQNFGRH
jgi:hypothetical protein